MLHRLKISIIILLITINISAASIIYLTKPDKKTITLSDINLIDREELLINLTTEQEKKGILIMIGIPDTILSEETISFLKNNKIMGVVLLGHNVQNEPQLKQLTSDLRSKVNPDILIAIDQEGGTVARIPWDQYAGISARQIGDSNDLSYAYEIAKYRAALLLDLGINVILGPVADIAYSRSSFMYDRSFSSDPSTVAKFVEKTVQAQSEAGIITVLKHFPGHGDTTTDSHYSLPVINKSKEELLSNEFLPFDAGIEAGAEMIMFGHVVNPAISENPASIEIEYLKILRDELGFEGVVITDDLKMAGGIDTGIGWGINMLIDRQANVIELKETYQPKEDVIINILDML